MIDQSLDRARAAKAHALEVFSRFGDVVGVGLTRIGDHYGIKVNFSSAVSDESVLPREVDGVPVKVEVVGAIRKQAGR
jgi:hypothetical protein